MATKSTDAPPGQTDWSEHALLVEARGRNIPGTSNPMRWFFSGIWLIYLIQPASQLFDRHDAAWIAGGLAITAVFCVLYMHTLMNSEVRPRRSGYVLVVLAVLASVACLVYGKSWTPLWIYVSAASGMVLTSLFGHRRAPVGIVLISAVYLSFCWLTHLDLGDSLAVLLPVFLIGVAMIGFRMQMALVRELAQARETVAKLATNEERLRLARDMHDLTGQSLSMITLKSELAAKRLTRMPASAERDAILTEMNDVSRVSRQTLHDIREAVSGYRRPTLAIEVITARSALEAAAIGLDDDPVLTMRSGAFDPEAEAVLAWCLREAVTNVIRHSRARQCRIRLTDRAGELSLEVADDGRGFAGSATGSGLRGMSERLSAIGGRLSLGRPENSRGFRLTATVPAVVTETGHNYRP